jgi:AraC-like DNA-binding protein
MKHRKFQRRILRAIPVVKQVFDENKSEDNIAKLATNLHISRNSLQSAFMQECGESIRKYKLRQRMEQAIQMLEVDDNIKEIALTLNYTHTRNFSTAFKKYYGVAPTEWPTHVQKQNSLGKSRSDKFGEG